MLVMVVMIAADTGSRFDSFLERLGAVAVVAAAVAALLVPTWRRLRTTNKRLEEFLDDWNGEPQRPGVPRRAGVMERLATVDDQLILATGERQQIKLRLSHVEDTIKGLG